MDSAKIMIVEDNTTVAKDLHGCLESLGYGVTPIVASGEKAIEKSEAERPDAVIMDIHLSNEMNGIDAAEQIYNCFDIPIVFLSAYSDPELLEQAKRVGSFGYLVKPFDERELFATLEMTLYKAKTEKECKQLEARLRQAQKMESLQVMAGSIAHNFNNILQGALGFTELALLKLPSDSQVREFVQKANVSVKRAAEMSTLMLVYAGQGQAEMKETYLSSQVQSTLDILQNLLNGTREKISLSMNLANEETAIKTNPAQLHQLVTNLFTNAVEAIGDNEGSITIATRVATFACDELKETYLHEDLPAGDYAILELTDTGCGMDKDTLAKVFDPFFTTKFTGRGLGLAAVLGIVRGHKGAIDIESEPGKGATFRVLFPVNGKFEAPVEEKPDDNEEH